MGTGFKKIKNDVVGWWSPGVGGGAFGLRGVFQKIKKTKPDRNPRLLLYIFWFVTSI